jgi:GDPmannose 4,6-dehydratase
MEVILRTTIMRAMITGINGQDGGYLAELLVTQGFEVIGCVKNFGEEFDTTDLVIPKDAVSIIKLDITNPEEIESAISKYKPDHFYNLAGLSHVGQSFIDPESYYINNLVAVSNLLNAIKKHSPKTKFLNCGSVEQFGKCGDSCVSENSCQVPVSPYGISKMAASHVTRLFRDSQGVFANTLIMTNHESPRRPDNFVVKKIVKGAVRIKNEMSTKYSPDPIILGDLSIQKDWMHAWDAVTAMYRSMNKDVPGEYIISTGSKKSIEDVCKKAFDLAGLKINFSGFGPDRVGKVSDLVVVKCDKTLFRPAEPRNFSLDSTKARTSLFWEPLYDFHEIVNDIYRYENKTYTNEICNAQEIKAT